MADLSRGPGGFGWFLLVLAISGCEAPSSSGPASPAAVALPVAPPGLAERSRAKHILLVADAWPPYNCAADDPDEGYMVDVARAVFEPRGYSVEYRVVPWRRALAGTRDGTFDGAIAPSKNEGPDLCFPERELARNHVSFFVRKGFGWRFDGPASLEGITLGVIWGYDYVGWLNDYVRLHQAQLERVQEVSGETPLVQNLKKLLAGRVDALAGNAGSIGYVARRLGLEDRIELAGQDPEESYCYIAFTPALDSGRRYAQILDEGIDELRRSGELARILVRYGLSDWVLADGSQGRQP